MQSIPLYNIGYGAGSSVSLTASGHYIAGVFTAINGKTIDQIEFVCSVGGVIDVQLETMDNEVPTGTLVAAGASNTGFSLSGTVMTAALTTPYTVTSANETIAVVFRWVSGTASIRSHPGSIYSQSMPRVITAPGTVTQRPALALFRVRYSDGTYVPAYSPTSVDVGTSTFTSTTNPDEWGTRIVIPYNLTVTGIQSYCRFAVGASTRLRLYDANLNVLSNDANMTINGDNETTGTATTAVFTRWFNNPIHLAPGTYYLTRKALTTSNIYKMNITWNNRAAMDSYSVIPRAIVSRNDDTGSFTEVADNGMDLTTLMVEDFFRVKVGF